MLPRRREWRPPSFARSLRRRMRRPWRRRSSDSRLRRPPSRRQNASLKVTADAANAAKVAAEAAAAAAASGSSGGGSVSTSVADTIARAKKAGGKKERRNRRMTARVKTLEEGQYKLFNILREIQEWWEAQAIVVVIGSSHNFPRSNPA